MNNFCKAAAVEAFKAYFTTKGQQRFGDRVNHFAPKVGVRITGIKIKDLGFRWASCGTSGVLNFHWACMMAPLKIIDYIVVHELCHLHQRNHSDRFWNEVDKVMPDYAERKEWLRKHGASLTL
ncbi:MAG: M48 family metallopeptidase [Pleurocapsa sp. SU_5_0]|nr:M48 family metallopeptidase [Pleurocapsa sp. SU_5_0]NJR46517.1 M48 family metallopeptidase [Hyellaceae cyanobacterium CSU_1_1]